VGRGKAITSRGGSAPLDAIVASYAPTNMLTGQELEHYINFAPQHHYVVQAALDRAIESGFILPADRAEILELAAATYP
jgi:hypothetical protein